MSQTLILVSILSVFSFIASQRVNQIDDKMLDYKTSKNRSDFQLLYEWKVEDNEELDEQMNEELDEVIEQREKNEFDLIGKKRIKRFILLGRKWFSTKPFVIKWGIHPKIVDLLKSAIPNALAIWSGAANLEFIFSKDDLTFAFTSVLNVNSTLYLIDCGSGKRCYIDFNPGINGSDLVFVHNLLVYSIGEALGFRPSSDPQSVMYSRFGPPMKNLSIDDIVGLQTLYGTAPNYPEYVAKNPKASDLFNAEDLCLNTKLDSVLEMPDKKLLLFKGDHYYTISVFGETLNSPRKINWDFSEAETPIDASLAWNDIIFLFKGNRYWKYMNKILVIAANIADGFPGLPDGPFDDVFQWNVNQKTYFFKGTQYWKYESKSRSVANGYPKQISDYWKGVPNSIDAAFSSRHRNQTYFFKDTNYYRFDDINKQVVNEANPPYPRETSIWFVRCRNTGNIRWVPLSTPPILTTTTTISPSTTFEPQIVIHKEEYEDYDENEGWIIFLSLLIGIFCIGILGTFCVGIYLAFFSPQPQPQHSDMTPGLTPEALNLKDSDLRHADSSSDSSGSMKGEEPQGMRLRQMRSPQTHDEDVKSQRSS